MEGSAMDLGEAIKREKEQKQLDATIANIGTTLLVLSGKGGVGKSSVSVNIAVGLALAGKRVGLLDLDMHGPSIPTLIQTSEPSYTENGAKIIPARYSDMLSVLSIQYLLEDPDAPILWRGPKKHSAIQFFLRDVLWGELDYLVIDTPPGTGDEHLTIMQIMKDLCAVVVTTPNEISLADVRKTIGFTESAGITVLGIIENMSTFVCPHCSEETNIFGADGGKELADAMDMPFLGSIPLDIYARKASEEHVPLISQDVPSLAKQSLEAIVAKIVTATTK